MLTQDPLERKSNEGSKQQPQPATTAADLILYYLEQIGVEYVFGIPGGGIEPLYDALARSQRRGGPRAVVARHETGAAFMADGYARESGKLGVCCATTGPGATNMITGVASAYMDHVPLLAITAQTSIRTFGRGAAQESTCTGINTVAMYEYCTRYNSLVSHASQLERKLISAITSAMHPPFGPAHLSIPVDVLRTPILIDRSIKLGSLLAKSNAVDLESVNRLHHILSPASNIIFILGPRAADAVGSILELAVLINAQVVTTPHAKGLVSSFHPQYRGIYGLAGHSTAHNILKNKSLDAILSIGSELDELATNGWSQGSLFSSKTIFIDSTPDYFARAPMAHYLIHGNIREIFTRLVARFQSSGYRGGKNLSLIHAKKSASANIPVIPFERRVNSRRHGLNPDTIKRISYFSTQERRQEADRRSKSSPPAVRRFKLRDEEKYLSASIPIKPQRLMYELSRLFPPSTRFLADIGNSFLWVIHYLHPLDRRIIGDRSSNTGTVKIGMGFSPMGWAIGAAVGTALATLKYPVVCITGDGALLMSGQELTTAIQEQLPIIFVILNDGALGTVKHGQQLAKAELIGFELPHIDFMAYAKAMGANAYTVRSPQDMIDLSVEGLIQYSGPTVLDVHIDPHEIPPLEERISMLRSDVN